MSDMLKVIEPKSDQINAEDLIGRDMTIVITDVQVRAGTEQPVSMRFEGSDKVFRPCKTVSRIIVAAWGPDTSTYRGRAMTLFRDESVKWAGMAVGGIRVKAISHIDQPIKLALAESKQNRKITVVQPLKLAAGQDEYTLADAEADLRAAENLDDLRGVWKRKSMAPYRAALQHVLDERKASLSNDGTLSESNPTAAEGRSDDEMGEAHTEEAA